jgi:hypothetical protein
MRNENLFLDLYSHFSLLISHFSLCVSHFNANPDSMMPNKCRIARRFTYLCTC